jgi:hypothetical protein
VLETDRQERNIATATPIKHLANLFIVDSFVMTIMVASTPAWPSISVLESFFPFRSIKLREYCIRHPRRDFFRVGQGC